MRFVLAPADKAANNVVVVGKRYYINTLSKSGCKVQESIQSSTTPNPGYQWESDKLTDRHHK